MCGCLSEDCERGVLLLSLFSTCTIVRQAVNRQRWENAGAGCLLDFFAGEKVWEKGEESAGE